MEENKIEKALQESIVQWNKIKRNSLEGDGL